MVTEVWTDGAFSARKERRAAIGGWAWATEDGRQQSGSECGDHVTSQRMEMRAALEACLEMPADEPIGIVSDSAYVVNCFNERWYEGWMANGWRTSMRKRVRNQDLWEPMIEIVAFRQVTFRHVRGHNGDEMNELVDKLAVAAKKERIARAEL